MTDEEKKAVETENKDLKVLHDEELEEVAGGVEMYSNNKLRFKQRDECGTGIGGGAKGGAIYNQGSI